MDNISLCYDADMPTLAYDYDEEEEDSGLGELSFPYIFIDGSNVATQTELGKNPVTTKHLEDDEAVEEVQENEFEDDLQDSDYIPSRSRPQNKRGKSRGRPFGVYPIRPGSSSSTASSTPVRSQLRRDLTRPYSRKDRTPNTILKMMERHRESERFACCRVRHHTLNEAMKDICGFVPGYDPQTKETKVIQMQRIIGYECFLENTISHIAGELGLQARHLEIGTHFVTDAMKDKKPADWFVLPAAVKSRDGGKRCAHRSRQFHLGGGGSCQGKYRREKISSPTVDSTTDNIQIVRVYPFHTPATGSSSIPTQGFIPIQPVQKPLANPLKIEVPVSTAEEFLAGDMESLFDQSLCSEPENLKSITATFMHDDLVPTSTFTEDNSDGFDLSSPVRNDHKVFLQSPQSRGTWHCPNSPHDADKFDSLALSEMTSVSPEFILETKPRLDGPNETYWLSETVSSTSSSTSLFKQSNMYQSEPSSRDTRHSYYSVTPSKIERTAGAKIFSPHLVKTEVTDLGLLEQQAQYSSPAVEKKNKRKRYTPHRSPFSNLGNMSGTPEKLSWSETEKVQRKRKRFSFDIYSDEEEDYRLTIPEPAPLDKENTEHDTGVCLKHHRSSMTSQKSIRVDLRRTSWMNGFMMFSRLNRKRFIDANPGVHTSHISKMMGHVWRNMNSEDQEPYREKAKQYSRYIRGSLDKEFPKEASCDCIISSSTSESTGT